MTISARVDSSGGDDPTPDTLTCVIASVRDRTPVVGAFVVWVVQPFTLGELMGDALQDTSDAVRDTCTVMAWAWWFVTLVALTVIGPVTLTIARIGAVAAVPVAVWAADRIGWPDWSTLIGLIAALTAAGFVLMPEIGDRNVDAASYGYERRYLLRPSGPVMCVVLPLTWALTVAALWTGPLLAANGHTVMGIGVSIVGLGVAVVGFRAMNGLSGRFVVFVPNGLVLHDRVSLAEPVLFSRREIAGLGPAAAHNTATDLTAAALGLALELKLVNPIEITILAGRRGHRRGNVDSVLFTPTRPAAVMETALSRGITIA